MGLELNVRLEHAAEVKAWLRKTKQRFTDLVDVNEDAGEELKLRHKRRLAAGIGVNGQKLSSKFSTRFGTEPLGGAERSFGTSLGYEATRKGLVFFSTWKGAAVAQKGMTIFPKHAKFLTIPLRAKGGIFETGGLGTKKNREGYRAREFKDTFFLRSRGRLFLMQKLGKGGKLRALFLLVRSMKYPKNVWFGANEADSAAIGKLYLDAVAGETK